MRKLILESCPPCRQAGQENVGLDIEGGVIAAVHPHAAGPEGRERVPGIALPGLPNLHSHTFQRGMAGLAETRGPAGDSFWTWRQVMYRFLGALTPEDVEAIAAFAMMEMLEGGLHRPRRVPLPASRPDGRPYADPAELARRIAAAARRPASG